MEFVAGKFEKLRVVKAFHFGPIAQDFRLNQEVYFDGVVVRMGVGAKNLDAPQLIAAIRAGWLVPVEGDEAPVPMMKAATVQVHAAQTTGTKRGDAIYFGHAAEDERVVGTVTSMKERTDASIKKANGTFNAADEAPVAVVQSRDSTPLEVEYPGVGGVPAKKYETVRDDGAGQGGVVFKTATHGKIDMGGSTSDSSGGVVSGKVASATKTRTILSDASQAESAIQDLENENATAPVVKRGIAATTEGASSEGIPVAAVTAAVKSFVVDEATVARELAALEKTPPKAKKFATVVAPDDDIKTVHSNGATGDVAGIREGDELADLLPDAAVVSDGFVWDVKKGHWMSRVKEAVAKYGDNPVKLKRIMDMEGPKVAEQIKIALGKK